MYSWLDSTPSSINSFCTILDFALYWGLWTRGQSSRSCSDLLVPSELWVFWYCFPTICASTSVLCLYPRDSWRNSSPWYWGEFACVLNESFLFHLAFSSERGSWWFTQYGGWILRGWSVRRNDGWRSEVGLSNPIHCSGTAHICSNSFQTRIACAISFITIVSFKQVLHSFRYRTLSQTLFFIKTLNPLYGSFSRLESTIDFAQFFIFLLNLLILAQLCMCSDHRQQ